MKIESVDDTTLGRMVRDRHARLAAAHKAGLIDTHPATQWNSDSKLLRACRDSMPGNVGEAKPIEDLDHDGAQDDPGFTPGTPGSPDRPGGRAAMDALIPGWDRMGNRHYEYERDESGIIHGAPRRR